MHEIGCGIRVYFENKKEFRNVVFFPDDTYDFPSFHGRLQVFDLNNSENRCDRTRHTSTDSYL